MNDAATIVYEPAHGRQVDAASQLAAELGSRMAARLVAVTQTLGGGRRRARRLAAVAAQEAASLLIVAVDEPSPLDLNLFGRGSAEVVRTAPCPVVLVPPALAGSEPPLLAGDHLLWAVADHCDRGCAAVVAGMARELELPVTVAHVLPNALDATASGELMATRLAGWLVDGLLIRLAEHDPQLADTSTVRLGCGDPGPQLRQLGDDEGAAMAVVGCRGWGSLRAAALGSVSSYLARYGATPVVVCPPAMRQAPRQRLTHDAAA